MSDLTQKPIKEWAADERPREKLLEKGPSALSNAELLAILIGSGTPQKSALGLARELLEKASNKLLVLARFTVADITRIRGLGPAKAIAIEAALELSRRIENEIPDDENFVRTSKEGERLFAEVMRDESHETFWLLCLNRRLQLISRKKISEGGLHSTTVDIRRIIRTALDQHASAIMIGHNHPSGTLYPSEHDIAITRKVHEATKLFDIQLVDHIIIAGNEYYSFSDKGLL